MLHVVSYYLSPRYITTSIMVADQGLVEVLTITAERTSRICLNLSVIAKRNLSNNRT